MMENPMLTEEQIRDRFIPFSSLRYSTEAFIDYRIPGCAPKKNYALIGPGVSQNPNQPVNLREKHGFQVGGVAMPPGKTNPPHMHFTAEVFICTKGRWDLQWGFNPDPLKAQIGPGDIASVPTWIYRGFQNVGDDEGFMFTALGQDDTGGILWGPQTLQAAQAQGVHLTEDYRIIDEQLGQSWDEQTMRRLQPMTPEEIAQLRPWSQQQMGQRVVRHAELQWSSRALLDAALTGCGAQLAPVIGYGLSEDRDHQAPIGNAHGFSIEWLKIPPGGQVSLHRLACKQVLTVHRGTVAIEVSNQAPGPADTEVVAITSIANGHTEGWDSFAMPAEVWRYYRNIGDTEALVLLMTPGDGRKPIDWAPAVQARAAEAGYAIDANGYLALKRYTDRSQR
jgi:quercetin dioxygenase-like cupin family protein